jgi:membrane-bound serine protease (ClpP class)
VVGGIALLLSLYCMAVIPVNYAGVGLIVFGMLLFLAEIKVQSHGILTVGGVISFVIGALMLTDVALTPMMRVSWQVIIVVTMLMLLLLVRDHPGTCTCARSRPAGRGCSGSMGTRWGT